MNSLSAKKFLLLLLAFIISCLILNFTFLPGSDDCSYGLVSFLQNNGSSDRFSSIYEVFRCNAADGYRPVVHFFVRLFAGYFPKWSFNICNALMAGGLLLLITSIANPRDKFNTKSLILATALSFLILFKGESYLWMAGSVNYLWSGVAALGAFVLWKRAETENISIKNVLILSPALILLGWTQESFVMPIGFAMGIYTLCHLKSLDTRKIIFMIAYALGAACLVFLSDTNAGRLSGIDRSVTWFIFEQIKIVAGLKAFAVLAFYFIFFCKDKKDFFNKNIFELLVILGSYLMISYVGFNGERSLWCANLFSIIILVRQIHLNRQTSIVLAIGLTFLFPILFYYGFQIRSNYTTCITQAQESDADISIHDRVQCSIFKRFFHQTIYNWQSKDGHLSSFKRYYHIAPRLHILTSELYTDLYLEDKICSDNNRIASVKNHKVYTKPTLTALIMPISNPENWQNKHVKVSYSLPQTLIKKITIEIAARTIPPVSESWHPEILQTPHGSYLLIVKKPGCDAYISDISFFEPADITAEH